MSNTSDQNLRTASVVTGTDTEIRPGRVLNVAHHAAPSGSPHASSTVFLAHGGGGNKNQWRYQWKYLVEAGYNVIAWDFLGHGSSPRPSPRSAQAYQGEQTLLDYLAIFERYKRAHNVLAGHSLGTRSTLGVLQKLAAQQRLTEVHAVLLLGTQLAGPSLGGVLDLPPSLFGLLKPLLARRFRRLAWHPDSDPVLVDYESRVSSGNSTTVMQAVIRNVSVLEPERLDELRLPVTVVSGDRDGLTPALGGKALADKLPQAAFIELKDCGHQIMLEKPELVNQLLRGLLALQQPVGL
ncbi:MAG: alpha/beta hydrolase [Paraburkholderia sp.]|jgi:pimeloyl-ACP methyl ester carboxylesterase|uniref:alpha/beta fold hydrolase n=1 Tax=Burkholderiaceae TaxID=119060 RepID=UPI0010F83DC1|nr:alpha/beta hydrolase [Burkholderia sp. 4M9327F10]